MNSALGRFFVNPMCFVVSGLLETVHEAFAQALFFVVIVGEYPLHNLLVRASNNSRSDTSCLVCVCVSGNHYASSAGIFLPADSQKWFQVLSAR